MAVDKGVGSLDPEVLDAAKAGVDYEKPQLEGVVDVVGDGDILESMSARARDALDLIERQIEMHVDIKKKTAEKIKELRAQYKKVARTVAHFDRLENGDD